MAKAGKKKGTTVEPPADVEESVKDALAELAVAREEQLTAAEGFFSQYANLLTKDARYHWDKIIKSQCDTAPWIDLQGKELLNPICDSRLVQTLKENGVKCSKPNI